MGKNNNKKPVTTKAAKKAKAKANAKRKAKANAKRKQADAEAEAAKPTAVERKRKRQESELQTARLARFFTDLSHVEMAQDNESEQNLDGDSDSKRDSSSEVEDLTPRLVPLPRSRPCPATVAASADANTQDQRPATLASNMANNPLTAEVEISSQTSAGKHGVATTGATTAGDRPAKRAWKKLGRAVRATAVLNMAPRRSRLSAQREQRMTSDALIAGSTMVDGAPAEIQHSVRRWAEFVARGDDIEKVDRDFFDSAANFYAGRGKWPTEKEVQQRQTAYIAGVRRVHLDMVRLGKVRASGLLCTLAPGVLQTDGHLGPQKPLSSDGGAGSDQGPDPSSMFAYYDFTATEKRKKAQHLEAERLRKANEVRITVEMSNGVARKLVLTKTSRVGDVKTKLATEQEELPRHLLRLQLTDDVLLEDDDALLSDCGVVSGSTVQLAFPVFAESETFVETRNKIQVRIVRLNPDGSILSPTDDHETRRQHRAASSFSTATPLVPPASGATEAVSRSPSETPRKGSQRELVLGPLVPCYSEGCKVTLWGGGGWGDGCIGTVMSLSDPGASNDQRSCYTVAIDNSEHCPVLAPSADDAATETKGHVAPVEGGASNQERALSLLKWDHTLTRSYDSYLPGTSVAIVDSKGQWHDSTIDKHITGSRYKIRWARAVRGPAVVEEESAEGRPGIVDLNDANHTLPKMSSSNYCLALKEYLEVAAKDSSTVVDGITGNKLRTLDQLVEIELIDDTLGVTAAEGPTFVPRGFNDVKTAVTLSQALTNPLDLSRVPNGRHTGAAVLVRAAAGTGKTWLTYQIMQTIAIQTGVPLGSRYVPYLLRVQQLATLIRSKGTGKSSKDLLAFYISSKHVGEERTMLLEAYRRRKLLLLLDGVDEASDLRDQIQDFVMQRLVPHGHRFMVTSRPEGVREDLYQQWFVVLDLKKYSSEQQETVLKKQILGESQVFANNLFDFMKALQSLDDIFNNLGDASAELLALAAFDNTISAGGKFREDCRQVRLNREPVSSVSDLLADAAQVLGPFEAEVKRIFHQMPISRDKTELAANLFLGLMFAPIKGEERCEQKRKQKYQPEVESKVRPGPAEAWLIDVVRCSIICKYPADILAAVAAIHQSEMFTVTRLKNYFVELDPTHFRRLGVTVLVAGTVDRPPHFAEIQIHLSAVFKFKVENKELMHGPYEYFRSLLGNQINKRLVGLEKQSEWMAMDQIIGKFGSFLSNPVQMSLFIVVLKNIDFVSLNATELHKAFPKSKAELYSKAIEQFIAQKIGGPAVSVDAASVRAALTEAYHVNHLVRKAREFTFLDLIQDGNVPRAALAPLEVLLGENPADLLRVPTLKVLDLAVSNRASIGDGVAAANFQSVHLSCQEYCCGESLTTKLRENGAAVCAVGSSSEAQVVLPHDLRVTSLTGLLNDKFFTNMLLFGADSEAPEFGPLLFSSPLAAFGDSFDPSTDSFDGHGLKMFFMLLADLAKPGVVQPARGSKTLLSMITQLTLSGGSVVYDSWIKSNEEVARYLALPTSIVQLHALEVLSLWGMETLQELPESIGQLQALRMLDISCCPALSTLPESIGQLASLTRINVTGGEIATLPTSLGQLTGLLELNCESKTLRELPNSIGELRSLVKLNLRGCTALERVPDSIGQLQSLDVINLSGCVSLTALPASMGQLNSLTVLDVRHCTELASLPAAVAKLPSLVALKVNGCTKLATVPRPVARLQTPRPTTGTAGANLCRFSDHASLPPMLMQKHACAGQSASRTKTARSRAPAELELHVLEMCGRKSAKHNNLWVAHRPASDVYKMLAIALEAQRRGCSMSSGELWEDVPSNEAHRRKYEPFRDQLPPPVGLKCTDSEYSSYDLSNPIQHMRDANGRPLSDAQKRQLDGVSQSSAELWNPGYVPPRDAVLSDESSPRIALIDEVDGFEETPAGKVETAVWLIKQGLTDDAISLLESAVGSYAANPDGAQADVMRVCAAKLHLARALDAGHPRVQQLHVEVRATYAERFGEDHPLTTGVAVPSDDQRGFRQEGTGRPPVTPKGAKGRGGGKGGKTMKKKKKKKR